jgi:hypothetical protein
VRARILSSRFRCLGWQVFRCRVFTEAYLRNFASGWSKNVLTEAFILKVRLYVLHQNGCIAHNDREDYTFILHYLDKQRIHRALGGIRTPAFLAIHYEDRCMSLVVA